MEPYCPEDDYCAMIAEVTAARRERLREQARSFLGWNSKRIDALTELLENLAIDSVWQQCFGVKS